VAKVIHIITGLNNGGAEGTLFRLCIADAGNEHIVISMMGPGKYGPLLVAGGIELHCLNMRRGRISFDGIIRLWRLLRTHQPRIVQTWMYHADLVGGIVARLAGVSNTFWNIRHSELEPGKTTKSTIWVAKLCALASYILPRKIICCAERSATVHAGYGYDASKLVVISNGYCFDNFTPDAAARNIIRKEFGIAEHTFLLGMVARFNAQKNHFGLMGSLKVLKNTTPDFRCLLIGPGMSPDNEDLMSWICSCGLEEHILLLGQRRDIPFVMSALDLHLLSSSFGEGFPNVLAEAMACGTPCVTTDVGDARLIVGETGWVLPVGDEKAFADAILSAIREAKTFPNSWAARRKASIDRVRANYSLERMIQAYHSAWKVYQ